MMGENGEIIYTDEDMKQYNDEDSMKLFLEDCHDFEEDINNLSTDLNDKDISKLNINSDINELIRNLKYLKKFRDNITLYAENKKEINKVFDKLKKDLVDLKNKHIHIYNEKVDYLNDKINVYTNRLNTEVLSQDVKDILSKLSTIKRCDIYINGNWDQNDYLSTLEYDKLIEMDQNIKEIESKFNVKIDEPLDLFVKANYIDNAIKKIRVDLKEELSLPSINSNLDKCITLLERTEDLNISYNNILDKLSEAMIIKYDNKIEKFRNEIKEIENELLDRKNSLIKKPNHYAILFNRLDQINAKYDMLLKKISEYKGKCSEEVIKMFNTNLDILSKEMLDIKDKIKEYNDKKMLNQEQLNNIYKKVSDISEKHKDIDTKLNDELTILKEEDKELHISKNISKLDTSLTELDNKVNNIEGIIKDKDTRKEIDTIIKDREKDLKSFEHLLLYLKTNEPDKYEELKKQVDVLKNKFEETCKNYRGKCPLRVKATKEIKHLYKKHKKLGLISAGLSSLALLTSAFSLIPAIMHGNVIIGNAIPALKGMFNFFNKILGGCIGAKLNTSGVYRLASGALLNASTATTALLKSLASFSGGVVAMMFPTFVPQMITKIKELSEKIKNYELKERLVNTYQKGRKKVEDTTKEVKEKTYKTKVKIENKIEEKKTIRDYENLFIEYLYSDMSIEEFCKSKDLSDVAKQWLELKEQRKKIQEETKKQEQEKLKELIKENRRKKNGR